MDRAKRMLPSGGARQVGSLNRHRACARSSIENRKFKLVFRQCPIRGIPLKWANPKGRAVAKAPRCAQSPLPREVGARCVSLSLGWNQLLHLPRSRMAAHQQAGRSRPCATQEFARYLRVSTSHSGHHAPVHLRPTRARERGRDREALREMDRGRRLPRADEVGRGGGSGRSFGAATGESPHTQK